MYVAAEEGNVGAHEKSDIPHREQQDVQINVTESVPEPHVVEFEPGVVAQIEFEPLPARTQPALGALLLL